MTPNRSTGRKWPGLAPFDEEGSWNANVSSAKFSADGSLLVISWGLSTYVFDVATGKEIQKVPADASIQPVAISPDRKRLATAALNGKPMQQRWASGVSWTEYPKETNLTVVDFPSGKPIWTQPLPSKFFGELAFSPTGKYLLVARSPDNQIPHFRSASGKLVHTIEGVPAIGWSQSPIISPDGKRLACGMADTSVLIWELPQSYR